MEKIPSPILVAMALCSFLAVASANPDAKPQQKTQQANVPTAKGAWPSRACAGVMDRCGCPKKASRRYDGTVTIIARGVPSMTVKVALEVKSEVLSDRGDADAASSCSDAGRRHRQDRCEWPSFRNKQKFTLPLEAFLSGDGGGLVMNRQN